MASETDLVIFATLALVASVVLLILSWRWKVDKKRFSTIMVTLQEQTVKNRSGDWREIERLKKLLNEKPLIGLESKPTTYEGRWQDQDHPIISGEGGKGWQDPDHPILV